MLIANPADRLNVARALIGPVLLFAPFAWGLPDGYELLTILGIFIVIGDANYILHLHIHRPFANKAWLNLLLDLAMAAATGMTASNWRIQHRYGHHRGIDKPFRPASRWEMERFSALRALSYSLRSVAPTFWHPIAESFRKGVLRRVTRPIDYRWAFAEQALLVLFVLALLAWQPLLVLTYLLPWYVLVYVMTRYVDYLNHYGCDERDRDVYARANNSLSPFFNWAYSNFGYHTAHHLQPEAHWTELPALHAAIEARIPHRHLKRASWTSLLFPYHCLLAARGRF